MNFPVGASAQQMAEGILRDYSLGGGGAVSAAWNPGPAAGPTYAEINPYYGNPALAPYTGGAVLANSVDELVDDNNAQHRALLASAADIRAEIAAREAAEVAQMSTLAANVDANAELEAARRTIRESEARHAEDLRRVHEKHNTDVLSMGNKATYAIQAGQWFQRFVPTLTTTPTLQGNDLPITSSRRRSVTTISTK